MSKLNSNSGQMAEEVNQSMEPMIEIQIHKKFSMKGIY